MKIRCCMAAAALLALAVPAHAERPDCGLFPDMHSRFACYDNVSRAPNPEPEQAAKPSTGKAKAAITRGRRARADRY